MILTQMALRRGSNAICEKPIVLNPWNIDAIRKIENESGKRIYNVLQLRHHKAIIDLKIVDSSPNDKVFDIDLTYLTLRQLVLRILER